MNIYPVVLDLETTGADIAEDSICQIGAVLASYTETDARAITLLSMLANPGQPIKPDASAVHGIKDEDVYWSTPAIWALRHVDLMLKELSKTGQVIICGQNQERFDIPLMHRLLPEAGFNEYPSIDTYTLALRLYPSMPHKLGELYEWFMEDEPIDAHDAAADCHMVARILGKYMREHFSDMSLMDLAKHLEEPVVLETMPFGKHKGLPCAEVPKGYYVWCMNNFNDSHKDMDATICHYATC